MSARNLRNKRKRESEPNTISLSATTQSLTSYPIDEKYFIPRFSRDASHLGSHPFKKLIQASFKLSFRKFIEKGNDSFEIVGPADDIEIIMGISTMLSEYNNENHKTEESFIKTHDNLSHANFQRIIAKDWLTDDAIALFLDSLNLDLNHNKQINDQAPTYCIGSLSIAKLNECFNNISQETEESFALNLFQNIEKGSLKSFIFNILKNHQEMKKINFVVNIGNHHFCSMKVDIEKKTITTIDPFSGQDGASTDRMRFAKILGVYFESIHNDASHPIYLGNKDMKKKQYKRKNNTEQASSFFHFSESNQTLNLPQQDDAKNCSLYSIYYIMHDIYKIPIDCSKNFDPFYFRHQMYHFFFLLKIFLDSCEPSKSEKETKIELSSTTPNEMKMFFQFIQICKSYQHPSEEIQSAVLKFINKYSESLQSMIDQDTSYESDSSSKLKATAKSLNSDAEPLEDTDNDSESPSTFEANAKLKNSDADSLQETDDESESKSNVTSKLKTPDAEPLKDADDDSKSFSKSTATAKLKDPDAGPTQDIDDEIESPEKLNTPDADALKIESPPKSKQTAKLKSPDAEPLQDTDDENESSSKSKAKAKSKDTDALPTQDTDHEMKSPPKSKPSEKLNKSPDAEPLQDTDDENESSSKSKAKAKSKDTDALPSQDTDDEIESPPKSKQTAKLKTSDVAPLQDTDNENEAHSEFRASPKHDISNDESLQVTDDEDKSPTKSKASAKLKTKESKSPSGLKASDKFKTSDLDPFDDTDDSSESSLQVKGTPKLKTTHAKSKQERNDEIESPSKTKSRAKLKTATDNNESPTKSILSAKHSRENEDSNEDTESDLSDNISLKGDPHSKQKKLAGKQPRFRSLTEYQKDSLLKNKRKLSDMDPSNENKIASKPNPEKDMSVLLAWAKDCHSRSSVRKQNSVKIPHRFENLMASYNFRRQFIDLRSAVSSNGYLEVFFAKRFQSDKPFCKTVHRFFNSIFQEDEEDDDERDILEEVIKIQGQMLISIQFVGQHQEDDGKNKTVKITLAAALFSCIKSKKQNESCSIIDYIGTVRRLPPEINPFFSLPNEKLRGMGLSRMLLLFIQNLTLTFTDNKTSQIRIKCPQQVRSWYEHCGFRADSINYSKYPRLKSHSEQVSLNESEMFQYVLPSNTNIDLNFVAKNKKLQIRMQEINYSKTKETQLDFAPIEKQILPFFTKKEMEDIYHSINKMLSVRLQPGDFGYDTTVTQEEQNFQPKTQFADELEYNEHLIPIGMIIEKLMNAKDSHLHLFTSPMMKLTRYFIKSMVWIIESINLNPDDKSKNMKSKKITKKSNTVEKHKGKQSFNVHLFCAYCRYEVDYFCHDDVSGDSRIQRRCKVITRCLHSFFAKHHQHLVPDSGILEYQDDFCQAFKEKEMIEELKEEQLYLHEFLHYDDKMKNDWIETNISMFDFVGDIFFHYENIVEFTRWKSRCVDKATLKKYANARVNPKRATTASGLKAEVHISQIVGELTGSIEKTAKEKIGKQSFQTKDTGRYKRFLAANNLIEDNEFIVQIDWLMKVDKTVDFDERTSNLIKKHYSRSRNKDSIKKNAKKYFIAGNRAENLIKIIDKNWIAQFCSQEVKSSLVTNVNTKIILQDEDKKEIRLCVKMYESSCVRYIHKFVDKKTKEITFCRAELKKTSSRSAKYIVVPEDIISHEFILDLVSLNKIPKFYETLMDVNVINKTYPVPEVSLKTSDYHPIQETNSPIMKYPQLDRGLCGICSMCSAIEVCYGNELADFIYNFRHEYHEHFIPQDKSKKSPIMTFLKDLVFKKRCEGYKAKHHTGKSITVSNLMNDSIYYNVVVALLKDSLGAKDHIVSFWRGWLFDSNLKYAIPISNINLDWCCGYSSNDAMFLGFYELFTITK